MNDFEKFEEELPSKEKFYSSLADRKISGIDRWFLQSELMISLKYLTII